MPSYCCHYLFCAPFCRRTTPVSDRCARLIFMLLGIGILVPWNAFISAVPYFQSRICSIPGAEKQFESWVGLIFNLSSVSALSLLLAWPFVTERWQEWRCLCFGRRRISTTPIPDSDDAVLQYDSASQQQQHLQQQAQTQQLHDAQPQNGHSFWLVTVPLALSLAIFLVTDLLVGVKRITPSAFLAITLWGMALCGACAAFSQAGTVATSGLFPARVGINPFVSGQAVGGVAVSAANFLSAFAEDPQDFWDQHCSDDNHTNTNTDIMRATTSQYSSNTQGQHSTEDPTCPPYDTFDTAVFFYFFVGAVVLFCCIVGYTMLDQSTHLAPQQEQYESVEMESARTPVEEFRDEPLSRSMGQQPFDIAQDGCDSVNDASFEADSNSAVHRDTSGDSVEEMDQEASTALDLQAAESVFQCVKGPAFCIFFTFFVTLALFPSWTSRLRSVHQCQPSSSRLSNDLYVPFTFLLFNIGDLGGREIAGRLPWTHISNFSFKLVMAACCRCLFFPLLLICVGGNESGHGGDKGSMVIESDAYSYTVQFFFALTNGFLISLAFMHAPTLLPEAPGAMQMSSEILTFALSLGLLCGSLFSFPVSELA